MRIVVDTNILISGIFFGGKPRELLHMCFSERFQMVCTEDIFIVYMETIDRLTVKTGKDIKTEIEPILIENLEFIENRIFDTYSRDPDDDKFINCAMSGEIQYIVSGDKDLLVLKEINGIEIITAAEFLNLFGIS